MPLLVVERVAMPHHMPSEAAGQTLTGPTVTFSEDSLYARYNIRMRQRSLTTSTDAISHVFGGH